MRENNYINVFYHFYSDIFLGTKGSYSARFFFNKMNKLKRNKKEIKINLFRDRLVKYLLKTIHLIKATNIYKITIFKILL